MRAAVRCARVPRVGDHCHTAADEAVDAALKAVDAHVLALPALIALMGRNAGRAVVLRLWFTHAEAPEGRSRVESTLEP